jgi:GT2 family glycosyltransferase
MPNPPFDLDISVIVPAYRAAATIGRALASIAAQTRKPREVIVIDDGSDDATVAAAEAMRDCLNGISLIIGTQENQGAGSARNHGVALARGEWLAFLDADDEWLAEKLERSFEVISAEPSNLVLIGHDVIVRDGGDDVTFDCAQHDVAGDDPFHAMYRRGYISTSTALTRRDVVLTAGGFDTALPNAQDFDLWLALLRDAKNAVRVFPGAYTLHHNQPGSIQTHTGRRLRCGMAIALRYIPELRRRTGSMLESLIFRIIAIHVEAMAAHRANRHWLALAAVVLTAPAHLLQAVALAPGRKQHKRKNRIPAIGPDHANSNDGG